MLIQPLEFLSMLPNPLLKLPLPLQWITAVAESKLAIALCPSLNPRFWMCCQHLLLIPCLLSVGHFLNVVNGRAAILVVRLSNRFRRPVGLRWMFG
ncbi:hypothetical protein Nepgr_013473 [Nepenthes gracilis]|uniref:Uncharacterized protein n=1 Tax=Nepenthes gracilis TaxID=150966 RepID=A0AAD3SI78_NEPGR|nr:hypothetical protein Nepgr_013473 [Nepenthes gracilis]